MQKRVLSVLITVCLIFSIAHMVLAEGKEPYQKAKQTVLGKYVTAKEAYEKWKANPETVNIVDVRTVGEYVYVGHTPMALNIPFMLYKWDPVQGKMLKTVNPKFDALIKKRYKAKDTILIMCRSGNRGAAAVNRLASVGYKNVYTITDGFEGDKIKDKHSYFKGKRMRNGWKNSGAPWTYELNPEMVYRD
ncbi:MAG: hypothetical protein KAQ71_01520 [Desulfobulbaceae bacterium]|nr:hypothetical protein [Desulfobulbaceae bacterium]